MIEIRPILPEEAEEFLILMCGVFELDYQRAITVFFSEPYFDLSRKWALFESGAIQSILTTTPLQFGTGRACGIAGVATRPESRGEGYSSRLIREVLDRSKEAGEGMCVLFARDERLYANNGFERLDVVVRGEIVPSECQAVEEPLDLDQVRQVYDAWANGSPQRLRRDDQRWRFWQWSMRTCEPFGSGYICLEVAQVREAICGTGMQKWPVGPATDWVGLRSLTQELEVPVVNERAELSMMGHGVSGQLHMFMTDQF